MQGKGLLKNPIDFRDYSYHKNFGSLGASQLPTQDFTIYDSFVYSVQRGDTLSALALRFGTTVDALAKANNIENPNLIFVGEKITVPARTPIILNQVALNFCTAYTTVGLQYAIFGIPFDPLYQMAKINQVIGSYTQQGATLRDACLSVLKFGSLQASSAPYQYTGSPTDYSWLFLGNWANYPTSLDAIASKDKDLSFFTVDGPNDFFDNIRSCLYMHQQERQAVTIGLEWHTEWTEAIGGIIPDVMPASQGEGHNMEVVGQKTINGELYSVFQQTWGLNAGDKGFYYFPRSIVNQIGTLGYGAYIFSRFDGSGLKASNFFGSILQALKNLFS